jgi:hypothetical protein
MLSIVAEIEMADNSRGGMSAKKVYPEKGNPKEKENIFILCDTCFWCAAYFGKFMLPVEDRCPICLTTELSSFPILSNESFTFDYDQKYGVELQFGVKNEY